MNVKTATARAAVVVVVLTAVTMAAGLLRAHAKPGSGWLSSSPEQRAAEASSAPAEQKSGPRISVQVHLVNVDTLVTDQDGRVLSGLKKENFRVLDNGRAQVIRNFEPPTNSPITVAMLIEYSGAASNHFAYKAASWGSSFLDRLEPMDWIALVTYDLKPTVRLDFTRNKAEMKYTLGSLSYPQFREANMYDAITDTLDRLDRVKGRKAIVLISTGADTFSARTLDDTLKRIKQSDVTIFTVGLAESEYLQTDAFSSGRSIAYLQAKNQLETFAKASGGDAWFPRFEGEIPDIFKSVVASLRGRYSIGFSPEDLKPDGKYHKLELQIVQPDGTPLMVTTPKGKRQEPVVYAREGYTAPSPRLQDAD